MKGLVVKSPWIELILSGDKTWEIRGTGTTIRGKIALMKSGSGLIYGTVELADSKPLTLAEYEEGRHLHRVPSDVVLPYKQPHAWILQNPYGFDHPIPYKHPQGAVIWVNLDQAV
jgi:hypothetical protein